MKVVCIASGPSLTQDDVDYCRGKAEVCVVNDNYRAANWATWLYAADHRWWISKPIGYANTNAELSSWYFAGERVTCDPGTAEQFKLRYVPHLPGRGLAAAPAVRGTLSGIEAVNFAVNEGATEILLLGYDFGGRGHWFGDHPETVEVPTATGGKRIERMNTATPEDWFNCQAEFGVMAAEIAVKGIRMVNCSRQSAIKCVEKATIQEAL